MSELRAWGEDIIKQLEDFIFVVNGRAHINPEAISRIIEAFAKAERVKMLEEVRPMIDNLWVAAGSNIDRHEEYMAWIDAEIKKLKEVK